MRTSIKRQLTGGILFFFLVLILTACTGREALVLELEGSGEGTERVWEPGSGAGNAAGTGSADRADEGNTTGKERNAETGTVLSSGTGEPETVAAESNAAVQEAAIPSEIYVHICGAVENPGVYILTAGSRVYEGVAAAGGFREDACEDFINQAGILQDGERLVIPTMEEVEAARADGSYQALWEEEAGRAQNVDNSGNTAGMVKDVSEGLGGLVNINTASESELGAIPGIGAGKAAAIVQYRQENGRFASIEDIMKVSGIKEGTFEKIKDKITVN